jgi:hypothetical protein
MPIRALSPIPKLLTHSVVAKLTDRKEYCTIAKC